VIPVPAPLLVLPWLLALAVWLAFPWLSRRLGRPALLRWMAPALVVVGGFLLWLSGDPVDGHRAPAPYSDAHAALCDARAALPDDRDAAVRAFRDRAHDMLHTLAADPLIERGLAADLLRAKEAVESRIAAGAPGAQLVAPMNELDVRASAALQGLGLEVAPCAG
jgi:hypothetical protein